MISSKNKSGLEPDISSSQISSQFHMITDPISAQTRLKTRQLEIGMKNAITEESDKYNTIEADMPNFGVAGSVSIDEYQNIIDTAVPKTPPS